jgi:hypothetical protein
VNTAAIGKTAAAAVMPAGSRRILPIDASRGLLMLFASLAHFSWWIHQAYPEGSAVLAAIGMVATPTFLMLSGAMVGMLCAAAARNGRDLKSQLFNRALFLLTVGHLLIALSEAHLSGGLTRTIRGVTVVDEIGLCTLIAAFFIPRLANAELCARIARRAVIALGIVWLYNIFWLPDSATSLAVEELLIGGNIKSAAFAAHSPVLQHIAMYAIGLPLGHFFARYVAQQVTLREVANRCVAIGLLLLSSGCLLRVLRHFADLTAWLHHPAIDQTLTMTQKTPPSPAYVMFYGGFGLLSIGILFWLTGNARSFARAGLEWMAVIGRASLLVFVLQYFLYWTLPDLLNIHPNRFCVLVFVGNVLLMRYIAGVWGRVRGNRWMTFGIKLPGSPSGSTC